MIIKIDVDGVIRDIFTPMVYVNNMLTGENKVVSDITEYDVAESFSGLGRDNREISDILFNKYGYKVFGEAKPYPGAKEAIDLLHDYGHRIVIATWQPILGNKVITLSWLDKYNIYYDDILFTDNKHNLNSDIIIDDNCAFLADDKSRYRYSIQRPYNKDCEFEQFPSLFDCAEHIILDF